LMMRNRRSSVYKQNWCRGTMFSRLLTHQTLFHVLCCYESTPCSQCLCAQLR
jgi:hypothetical protein